ncbi:MAG: hypothetical protein ACYCX3_02655 [Thermoleophilia bacterium]
MNRALGWRSVMRLSRRSAALATAVVLVVFSSVVLVYNGSEDNPEADQRLESFAGPMMGRPTISVSVATLKVDPEVRSAGLPREMMVYAVDTVPLDRQGMDEVADTLGVEVGRAYGERGLAAANWQLVFPRGDDLTCFSLVAPALVDGTFDKDAFAGLDVALPDPEEARALADAFIGERQLEELRGTVAYEGTYIKDTVTLSTSKTKREIPTTIAVSYGQLLNGISVMGPGSRLEVVLGQNGAVLSYHRWLPAYRLAGKAETRALDSALGDIKAGRGVVPAFTNVDAFQEITVLGVALAYWAEPLPEGPQYCSPVFVFDVVGSGGSQGKWFVSATGN